MGKLSRQKRRRPPKRTRSALMAEILAAASGKPVGMVGALLDDFKAAHPGFQDDVMGEAEYRERREALMLELPGIARWLAEGARRPASDAARVREVDRFIASLN